MKTITFIQKVLDTKIGATLGTMAFGAALAWGFVYGWAA
ncbi:hypothetical protein [Burkholderia phage BCSR5]|nr:hypothetical protein [Burkholderia phage BCSR5]